MVKECKENPPVLAYLCYTLVETISWARFVYFSPLWYEWIHVITKTAWNSFSPDLWGFAFPKDVLMLDVFGINNFELSHYWVWELAHLRVAGLLALKLNGLLCRILREFLGEQLLGNLVLVLSVPGLINVCHFQQPSSLSGLKSVSS